MENMTFEEVEIVTEPTQINFSADDKMWAILPLIRPHAGELVIEVPFDYGRTLAEEVCGIMDEEISEAAIKDVLAEIANTIAGRFVDELLPADEEFELGLPNTGRGKVPQKEKKVTTVLLNVGGHALVTSIVGEAFQEFTEN